MCMCLVGNTQVWEQRWLMLVCIHLYCDTGIQRSYEKLFAGICDDGPLVV